MSVAASREMLMVDRFMIIPEMLKNAPMFKRIDPKSKVRGNRAALRSVRPSSACKLHALYGASYSRLLPQCRQRAPPPAWAAVDALLLLVHKQRQLVGAGGHNLLLFLLW